MNGNLDSERVLRLGLGFWGAKTLLSAVELGVFTELAKGALNARTLAARLGLHPRAARDFFDALVALNLLERDGELYTNTPDAEQFLDRAKPSYVGGLLEMAESRLYPVWGALTEALRSGLPQNEAQREGNNYYQDMYQDPARLRTFLAGMTGLSLDAAKALSLKFPWAQYGTFVDIGGAQGVVPVRVATAHQHLSGGAFDLPPVEPFFNEYVSAFGLQRRLRFYPGDFFTDGLPSADVLVMGHILHNWNLEEKRLLVAKAFDALPRHGALIVYDALIDDERSHNAFGLLMSLNMLLVTAGGFLYTGAECQAWMREAGFRETRLEHLAGPDSMVVGVK